MPIEKEDIEFVCDTCRDDYGQFLGAIFDIKKNRDNGYDMEIKRAAVLHQEHFNIEPIDLFKRMNELEKDKYPHISELI